MNAGMASRPGTKKSAMASSTLTAEFDVRPAVVFEADRAVPVVVGLLEVPIGELEAVPAHGSDRFDEPVGDVVVPVL